MEDGLSMGYCTKYQDLSFAKWMMVMVTPNATVLNVTTSTLRMTKIRNCWLTSFTSIKIKN